MASQRLVTLLGAFALVLLSVSQVSAVEIDYTLTVEGDGPYTFSLPWSGESHWFLDGEEVTGFVVDPATGVTSGILPLTSGETYSLHIQLIGDETPSLPLITPPGVSVSNVPEPGTLLLLGLGLSALAIAANRRARRDVAVRR